MSLPNRGIAGGFTSYQTPAVQVTIMTSIETIRMFPFGFKAFPQD
jgi:hypothetical protein